MKALENSTMMASMSPVENNTMQMKFGRLMQLKTWSPRVLLAAGLSLGSALAFAGEVTKTLNLKSFDRLDLAGNVKVNVVQGKETSVKAVAEKEVFENLKIQSAGGVLKVEPKSKGLFGNRCPDDCEIRLDLVLPDLKEIEVSGAVEVKGEKLNLNLLEVDASGAAEIYLQNSKIKVLDLDTSGAVEAVLSGSAEVFKVDASGATEIEAENFIAETVQLDLSGASDVKVHATKVLETDLSGASKVVYKGNPAKVKQDISGAAKMSSKG